MEILHSGRPHTSSASLLTRAIALLRWPFTNRYAAPIWLALRLYLGWVWLQFGVDKLQAGWLTKDAIGPMLKLGVDGTLPLPVPMYSRVAALLLDLGVTPIISFTMPFVELAVGVAFLSGVLVIPAAIGAILLNLNIILSGIGQIAFDGRIIALQVLLIMAWPIAERLGLRSTLAQGWAWLRQRVGTPGRLPNRTPQV
jgi:thiosulfate dehydrogenase [quinone] large subunit